MGFLVTNLVFVAVGIIALLCTRICCNKGPSPNLFRNGNCLLLDDVGDCICCTNESTDSPNSK